MDMLLLIGFAALACCGLALWLLVRETRREKPPYITWGDLAHIAQFMKEQAEIDQREVTRAYKAAVDAYHEGATHYDDLQEARSRQSAEEWLNHRLFDMTDAIHTLARVGPGHLVARRASRSPLRDN